MDITLKNNLRELRKKKNVTQEMLAEHIGISTQAVGKWERGEGFPDITLLPVIAFYFNVSVDDLLGVGEVQKKFVIEEYMKKSVRLKNIGNVSAVIELWESAYREYPNDSVVLVEIMSALFNSSQKGEYSDRIISTGEKVLSECTDNNLRSRAISILCFIYNCINDAENAKKYANMLNNYYGSREETMKNILDGEDAVIQCQENIVCLVSMINGNADVMSYKGNYSAEERIRIHKFRLNLYKLVYEDGDFGFSCCRLAQIYYDIAVNYALIGDKDAVIENLQEMAKYAVMADTQPDGQHTSFLIDMVKYNLTEYLKNYKENECGIYLKKLEQNKYDFLRGDERFIKIINKLSEVAK